MSPEQKEIYRNNILLQLDTARAPMLGNTLFIGLKAGGFTDSTVAEMKSEIEYLIAKGLVSIERAAISAGVKRYKITADGIEYVEANL
jgi:hypothetical protein